MPNAFPSSALVALNQYDIASEQYAVAVVREMEIEDGRSTLKDAAVRRIMDEKSIAYTPAEKLVETDAEYVALLKARREVVLAKTRLYGERESARMAFQLAVTLARVSEEVAA